MVADRSSDTSLVTYDSTRCDNPEGHRLSYTALKVWKIITVLLCLCCRVSRTWYIHISQSHFFGSCTPCCWVTPRFNLVYCLYWLSSSDFYIVKLWVFFVQVRGRVAIERKPPCIFNVTSSSGRLGSVLLLLPFLFLAKRFRFWGLRSSAPSPRLSRLLPHALWLGSCICVAWIRHPYAVHYIRVHWKLKLQICALCWHVTNVLQTCVHYCSLGYVLSVRLYVERAFGYSCVEEWQWSTFFPYSYVVSFHEYFPHPCLVALL